MQNVQCDNWQLPTKQNKKGKENKVRLVMQCDLSMPVVRSTLGTVGNDAVLVVTVPSIFYSFSK